MSAQSTPQGHAPGGSLARFSVWRQDAVAFEDLSAYYFSTMNLTEGNDPKTITATTRDFRRDKDGTIRR